MPLLRSAPPPLALGAEVLYRKLQVLNWLRLGVGTALLVATATLRLGSTDGLISSEQSRLPYVLIVSIYVGSLVAALLLRTGRYLRALAIGQLLGDLIAASGFVYLTGGAESFSTILYPVAIISGAISLGRPGAWIAAGASALCFVALVLLMERGIVGIPAAIARPPLPLARLLASISANLLVFLLTAALSSVLAAELQGTRSQLEKRVTEYDDLRAEYDSIVRSISTGILTISGAQLITLLNPAGEAICGVALRNIRGMRLGDALPEFAEALRRSQPGRGELHLRRSDGSIRIVGFQQTPLVESSTGSLPGLLLWFQDLTELRLMQEAMQRSERLAAVGKLSAGLAHEIRNPLASMTGSIQMLAATQALSENERRLMQIVLREGERLEALVKDFLAFARPVPPVLVAFSLSQLVEEVLALFQPTCATKGLQVTTDIEPEVRIRADAPQLRQVLWNLLGNAADATRPGGTLRVRVVRGNFDARLEVEDTGEGISPEDVGRIFDPFFTTKERGSGMGLSIVHRIIESHGGRIDVRSTLGAGSQFVVSLPT